MGHANITMTLNYYAHADGNSAKAEMERIEKLRAEVQQVEQKGSEGKGYNLLPSYYFLTKKPAVLCYDMPSIFRTERNGQLKPTDELAGSERCVWWKCDKGMFGKRSSTPEPES